MHFSYYVLGTCVEFLPYTLLLSSDCWTLTHQIYSTRVPEVLYKLTQRLQMQSLYKYAVPYYVCTFKRWYCGTLFLWLRFAQHCAVPQLFLFQGVLTGREMEVRVVGSVDGEPVRVAVNYEDGRRARLQASYRSPQYFTISFTTHLRDISIGFRNVSMYTFLDECCFWWA